MRTSTSRCLVQTLSAAIGLALAAQPEAVSQRVKIEVRETGIYRVAGRDLAAAGIPLSQVAPARIAITCHGVAVPCRLEGIEDGQLTDESALVFYGVALDTRYTDTNAYWLTWRGEPGPRMQEMGFPVRGTGQIASFRAALHLEENHKYVYLLDDAGKGELDPWNWVRFAPQKPAHIRLDLPHLTVTDDDVAVRACVRGVTWRAAADPDHHVVAEVNGQPLGEAHFDGQAVAVVEGVVAPTSLKPQGNELVVSCPGDTQLGEEEQVNLDWVEVEYARDFAADDGRIGFSLPSGTSGAVTVTELQGSVVGIYHILSPSEVISAQLGDLTDRKASFPVDAKGEGRYLVATREAHLSPSGISLVPDSRLRSPQNRADVIIVAYDAFRDALAPLVELRESQGLKVAVVSISDVYNEFSDGIFTPVAIRDFLQYAYRNWSKPVPRYVLLVGDANYDYRDYLGTGERNYVPAYPVRVRNSIETPTDAYFVCLEGDDHIPEMLIGRLPGRTSEQVRRLCERIVAYETSPPGGDWRRQVLLLADYDLGSREPDWFENTLEADARKCESLGMQAKRVYLRAAGLATELSADENRKLVREKATPAALQALEQGCVLFLFKGHGAAHMLSAQRVLQIGDVAGLDNKGMSPLGVLVTCFSGAFDDPEPDGGQCIAEHMLNAPSGLIACVGPTRLGGLNIQVPLVQRLIGSPAAPVGEVLAAAKQDLLGGRQAQWESVENYNLLGDPLLTLQLDVQQPEGALGDDDDN